MSDAAWSSRKRVEPGSEEDLQEIIAMARVALADSRRSSARLGSVIGRLENLLEGDGSPPPPP